MLTIVVLGRMKQISFLNLMYFSNLFDLNSLASWSKCLINFSLTILSYTSGGIVQTGFSSFARLVPLIQVSLTFSVAFFSACLAYPGVASN